jgi:S1-C subfamily serine protease
LELGISARDLTTAEKKELETDGVYVEEILQGSKIAQTNMEKEYIITKINGKKISSTKELRLEILNAVGTIVFDGFYEKYPGDYPYAFKK